MQTLSKKVAFLIAITVALTSAPGIQAHEKYATEETREVITKMTYAHGGLKKWRSIPTLSYEHDMLIPGREDKPWRTEEVIDPHTRNVYQEWPLDHALVVKDGRTVWSVGWKKKNPPGMMATVSFFFLNLPFITQDPGIVLGEVERAKAPDGPETDKEYLKVRMRYHNASEYEYYDLYIDPKTYLLYGVQYTTTYKPLIRTMTGRDDVPFLGPLFKVYDKYVNVDGLKLASEYTTYAGGKPYGRHLARNYSTTKNFDPSWLKRPENAEIFDENNWPPEQNRAG